MKHWKVISAAFILVEKAPVMQEVLPQLQWTESKSLKQLLQSIVRFIKEDKHMEAREALKNKREL